MSAILGLIVGIYVATLPQCQPSSAKEQGVYRLKHCIEYCADVYQTKPLSIENNGNCQCKLEIK